MSKLEELIKELCPDGVEYDKLDSVIDYEQPVSYTHLLGLYWIMQSG